MKPISELLEFLADPYEDEETKVCEAIDICGCIGLDAVNIFKKALLSGYVDDPVISVARTHLENIGLMEHGVSIRGAFPTPEGKQVIKALGWTMEDENV